MHCGDGNSQCPGECSQEDVVQYGCHDLAGILVDGWKEGRKANVYTIGLVH